MQIHEIEDILTSSLIKNDEYFSKVFGQLKEQHFSDINNSNIFNHIKKYYAEYSHKPSIKELGLFIKNDALMGKALKDEEIEKFKSLVQIEQEYDSKQVIDSTEKYIKKQEMTAVILSAIDTIKKDEPFEALYGKMGDVLKISFDSDLGTDVYDIDKRIDALKKKVKMVKSGIDTLDSILGGGFEIKTLSLFVGFSGSGKSLVGSNIATNVLFQKKNVLVISMEMSELAYFKRIDANMLDIDVNQLKRTDANVLRDKFNSFKDKLGELIIKEYPVGSDSTLDIERLVEEYKRNENLQFDVIVVDYLGILKSYKQSYSVNTYIYQKSVAEELRALAQKLEIPVISFAQTNRSSSGKVDTGMDSIADSLGIVQTADNIIAIINTKELKDAGQILIRPIKNRNTGITDQNYSLGIQYSKMRITDLDNSNPNNDVMSSVNQIEQYTSSEEFTW